MERALAMYDRLFKPSKRNATEVILIAFTKYMNVENIDNMSDEKIFALLTRIHSLIHAGEEIVTNGVAPKEKKLIRRVLEGIRWQKGA